MICLFEDAGYRNLLPLVYTKAVYELRCGIFTLGERLILLYPESRAFLHCREYLLSTVTERLNLPPLQSPGSEPILFLNGRVISNQSLSRLIPPQGEEVLYLCGKTVVGARLNGHKAEEFILWLKGGGEGLPDLGEGVSTSQIEVTIIEYPWDLVANNEDLIREDFKGLDKGGTREGEVDSLAKLSGEGRIYLGAKSRVEPFSYLDASQGPIYIDKGAIISSHSRVEGPAYIGEEAIITGGKIRGGCSIGPGCRVGGEVEATIFEGFANKYHSGFLGHSYIGKWVNLGALTTNSDLKNNYKPVKVQVSGGSIDTGIIKLGSFIADHAKTGIGTLLNTGTVIGVGCNIFGGGLPPKYIPSFLWGGGGGFSEYKLHKFLETAQVVMERRGKVLSSQEKEALSKVFALSREEREEFLNSARSGSPH